MSEETVVDTRLRDCWADPKPDDLVYVRYEMRIVLVTKTTVVYATNSGEVHAISREDWANKASMSGQRIVSRGE